MSITPETAATIGTTLGLRESLVVDPADPNFPPDECACCGGHIGWIDRGDHWTGRCHGRCSSQLWRPKGDAARSAYWERVFRSTGVEVPDNLAAAAVRISHLKAENADLRQRLDTALNRLHDSQTGACYTRNPMA